MHPQQPKVGLGEAEAALPAAREPDQERHQPLLRAAPHRDACMHTACAAQNLAERLLHLAGGCFSGCGLHAQGLRRCCAPSQEGSSASEGTQKMWRGTTCTGRRHDRNTAAAPHCAASLAMSMPGSAAGCSATSAPPCPLGRAVGGPRRREEACTTWEVHAGKPDGLHAMAACKAACHHAGGTPCCEARLHRWAAEHIDGWTWTGVKQGLRTRVPCADDEHALARQRARRAVRVAVQQLTAEAAGQLRPGRVPVVPVGHQDGGVPPLRHRPRPQILERATMLRNLPRMYACCKDDDLAREGFYQAQSACRHVALQMSRCAGPSCFCPQRDKGLHSPLLRPGTGRPEAATR